MSKHRVPIHGLKMAYVEAGEGDPIVFLHGNPTSSFLWRNVIPHLELLGRCIAPDLIGMGDSEKLPESGPDSYRFVEHRRFLDALLERLEVRRDVTLVLHDWGSGLGFDWAYRHQDALKGIAHMESIVKPLAWDDLEDQVRELFQALRSPMGEQMILEENRFIEEILPGMVMRDLTNEEMTVYRRPYLEAGESRRPMLTWPRQVPYSGEPADVHRIVDRYAAWLPSSLVPKLLIDAEPGVIFAQAGMRDFARGFASQEIVEVEGLHFIQEDVPDAIGESIAGWYEDLTS